MVETQFENLLQQFEPFFKCPLKTDENGACLIKLKIGINIQIELNRYGLILIACRLGQTHGRFQDQLFEQALKANFLELPSTGTVGYSRKSDQLIIFKLIDPLVLTPSTINSHLEPMIAKAKIWHEAIANNEVPPLIHEQIQKTIHRPFGL